MVSIINLFESLTDGMVHYGSLMEFQDVSKNGVLAVQTLRNNIMASTLLASTAIMLSSLIAVLMTSGAGKRSSVGIVLGNKSELAFSIKFFSILVCFLVAFLLNVQSIRYYSHASILINVPYSYNNNMYPPAHQFDQNHRCVTAEYVGRTVNRGSYFWSLGLRAFYFSFPLFLWIFGPIPMFLCCFLLIFLLYFLDVTMDFGWVGTQDNQDQNYPIGDEDSSWLYLLSDLSTPEISAVSIQSKLNLTASPLPRTQIML